MSGSSYHGSICDQSKPCKPWMLACSHPSILLVCHDKEYLLNPSLATDMSKLWIIMEIEHGYKMN